MVPAFPPEDKTQALTGNASIARVTTGRHASLIVRGANLSVARLSTAAIRELAPSVKLTRTGTLDGHLVVSGAPSSMLVDADVRFDDAKAGRSHVLARGGIALSGGVRARDLEVRLLPLQVATLSGAGLKIPVGGVLSGDAVVSGTQREGWSVRGDERTVTLSYPVGEPVNSSAALPGDHDLMFSLDLAAYADATGIPGLGQALRLAGATRMTGDLDLVSGRSSWQLPLRSTSTGSR